ncbi:MAG: pyridoxamine 5'-phosphate oxidase family protein [Coriobacteriia bacterium]|nr:pyridoxamine 5'-phosphate oxidase family protein [Coriobacteriia bacterium]
MDEVYELLKKVGTYYLATVDADKARVRPMGTINVFENKLYIQTGRSKDVAKQIFANPNVEVCAFDAETGTWIRISAKLIADERREAKQSMLDAYPNLAGMYSVDDDNMLVLCFEDATARFDSFGGDTSYVDF